MSIHLLTLAYADFNGHMDWDGGWSVVMVVGMVLFWALLIAGIVWVVRDLSRGRVADPRGTGGEALRILDRRLADGSISPDDYRERRAMLAADESDDDG